MPDRYNIQIRRICESDSSHPFQTGYDDFDKANPSKTLMEYWQSDNQKDGLFTIYLLIEVKNNEIIGLLRLRNEWRGANPNINDSIPEIDGKPAVYLSRVGLVSKKRNYHLGRILTEYFFYIAKHEMKNKGLHENCGYWKCPKDKIVIGFYESFGAKVIKEYSGDWGPAVVMMTKISLN